MKAAKLRRILLVGLLVAVISAALVMPAFADVIDVPVGEAEPSGFTTWIIVILAVVVVLTVILTIVMKNRKKR